MWLSWFLRSIPGEVGIRIRRVFLRTYFCKCGSNIMIHPGVKIRGVHALSVGDNVGLGDDCFLQATGGLEIGNNVSLGPGVKIWSQNHTFGPDGPVNDEDYEFKKVVIGDDVWIAADVFVMPGATISNGMVISAGSVVGAKQFPEYSIIGGNPARLIGTRKDHKRSGKKKIITETS